MNWKLALSVLAAVVTTACGSGSKGLSVAARTAEADQPAGADALDLRNGIVLDRVRLVVKRIELEGAPLDGRCASATMPAPGTATAAASSGGGDDGGSHDGDGGGHHGGECELEFGPFLVDLTGAALAAGIHQVFDVPVPAGTYRELEFKFDTLSSSHSGGDAGLAEMSALHASVAIDGRVDGAPFRFTTSFEAESKHEGAIVVDPDSGAGVTLDIDPSGWFGTAAARLDPSDAANRGAILNAIRASIRVEHDDDHDGCDDDGDADDSCGGHGGGGSGGPGPG